MRSTSRGAIDMPNDSSAPPGDADWDALARFFAGESTPDEAAIVRRWLAAHPEEAAVLTATDAATARLRDAPHRGSVRGGSAHGDTLASVDVDAAWRRMAARLDERPVPRVHPLASRSSTPVLRAAAAMLLVAASATLWWTTRRDPSASSPVVAALAFQTEPGRRDSVVLADGTGVLLGPGSSLRVGDGYGDGRRDLHLVGEAMFDVRHDDARPFVVHVAGAMVQDLGTRFTVRTTNGTSGATTVAVTAGAVRVTQTTGPADSGVVLRAGDVARLGAAGPTVVREADAVEDALAFTRGQLVFRDAALSEVTVTLRRWYGVDVRIGGPRLAARTFTGTFDGEPLAFVLTTIGRALDVSVQRSDSIVTIEELGGRGGSRR